MGVFVLKLSKLSPEHYRALYEIVQKAEPVWNLGFVAFCSIMETREGFVAVANDGTIVGAGTFSHMEPGLDIVVHAFCDPAWHRRWANKRMLRQIFDFPFIELDLPRVSGFSIVGVLDAA